MPDYDIDRLGDRAFEQLVVSLAAHVLGPGIQAFGDGPDGGREATFDGPIDWSATTDSPSLGRWDGYTVLQAKFHYHQRSTKGNASWLKQQIDTELDRWVTAMNNRTRTRAPQYLIIASNVRLSSVGVSGGIDTLTDHITGRLTDPRDAVFQLRIRGFRIWHADQIHTYLDNADTVRHAFPALLTVGDVLARITDHTTDLALPDLATKMRLHAGQCLRNEHWVRFSESGAAGQRAKLEDIGIDLPGSLTDPIDFDDAVSVRSATVQTVAHIISHGDTVLRRDLHDRVARPHWLIIGGPGQGKTTLSSLIAQIYRMALMGRGPMTPEVSTIVEATRNALKRTDIPEPRNLRWPMRVDLSNYAEVLAAQPDTSLLAFLATTIGLRTATAISSRDLHNWLKGWPWAVILDGLDEVSDARMRRTLLERVTDFIETADSLHADLLLIATTRPLGYDEQFDTELFTDIILKNLTPQQARTFAREIAATRLAEDPELEARVTKRLDSASKDPATQRLMQTPLQVTIMSIIVEGYATLPVDRFGLFSLYYRTIYQRELDKPGSAITRILNEHKSDIDYLHARVALHLHVAAENADAGSTMSISQLEAITRDRLQAQEYTPREVDTISAKLVIAATHRLVLLVPAGDRIGFEVRSLQELMAAIAITTGPEAAALKRLQLAMHHPHWRNVWLLAAGRMFKEREHLHDQLVDVLLPDHTTATPVQRMFPSTAVVACDILDDGFASRAPRPRRRYLQQVLQCLDYTTTLDDAVVAASLARVCTAPEDRTLLFSTLETALSADGMRQIHAYVLLRLLGSTESDLALEAVEVIRRRSHDVPTDILETIHQAFKSTEHHQIAQPITEASRLTAQSLDSNVDATAQLLVTKYTLQQDHDQYHLTIEQASALGDVMDLLTQQLLDDARSALSRHNSRASIDLFRPPLEVINPEIEKQLTAVLATLSPRAWRARNLVWQTVRQPVVRRPIGPSLLDGIT